LKLLWNQLVLRTRFVKARDKKSIRKIAAYCQRGRMVFQARVTTKKAIRNPAFAHNNQGGIVTPRALMKMSGRSETTSITTQAVRIIVRFAVELVFILSPPNVKNDRRWLAI